MPHEIEQIVRELATLRAAFEAVRQAVLIVDAHDHRIVDANPAACQTLGIARGALIGSSWASTAGQLPHTTLRSVGTHEDRLVVLAHEPASEEAERRGMPHDVLTGLASREALLAYISRDDQRQQPPSTGLLFIDLDNFKQVNDAWGHVIGDRVLRAVADRLADCIRPSDLLVRYGGDEFIMLIEEARRRAHLERLVRRIRRRVQLPIQVAGHEFTISASIGIAKHNAQKRTTVEALIAQADQDMYRAKERNRNSDGRSLPGSVVVWRPVIARVNASST